jgi:hypothetical protein
MKCPLEKQNEGLDALKKQCIEINCSYFGSLKVDIPENCSLWIEALCHVKSVGQG